MPGLRSARVPILTLETRSTLGHRTRGPSTPAGLARRARIVLLAADGVPLWRIGTLVGCDRNVVRDGLDRFGAHGLDGLHD